MFLVFLHKVSEPNNLLTIFKYWIFLFFLYEVYLIQIHGTFQANQRFVRSVNDILFVVLFVPSFLLLIKTDVFFYHAFACTLLLEFCCSNFGVVVITERGAGDCNVMYHHRLVISPKNL